jgi:DNA-binding MarR family transcriptional regulator
MGDDKRTCAPGTMVLLTRLAKQVYRRSDERELGMHLRLLGALSFVNDYESVHQQELGEAFCMDANNVVLILNELEDLGFVARRRDPADRRRHLVEITAQGKRALAKAERAQEAVEEEVLHSLSPDERAVLHDLLTRALRGAEPSEAEQPQQVMAGAA